MSSPSLVVLAAGLSTRFGSLKQLAPIGPHEEALMDYNVFDAVRAGFREVVYVVRPEIEDDIRSHVGDLVGDVVSTHFVHQTLDQIPAGYRVPPDRRKPWGTAQAVLCAAPALKGPFAVCNADDLYGPDAFRQLAEHLRQDSPPTEATLVGYTLSETLSGSGGVARGICVPGREGLLEHITEVRDIRQVDGWITGRDTDGETVELRGNELVSMNLWGFTPPVVELLGRQLARFLARWGANTDEEFLLSTALNGQVELGATRVAVLHSTDPWFGVTHAADHEEVREALAERIRSSHYPEDLREALGAR
jgi:hypothetical protein